MPCSITLAGMAYDCQPSVGGIKYVLLRENFDEGLFVLDSGATKISAVTATTIGEADGNWKKYEFRRGTGSMTSTLNVDEANGTNYVSTELSLSFAKQETAKRIEMAALAVGQVQAIVVDCNNHAWALGFNEGVVASAAGAETGAARGDGNRYTLTLTDYSESFPYEVDPAAMPEEPEENEG